MKFKRITAMLLSAATLAAMPTVPVLRNALPDTAITAEAADTYVRQITVGDVTYKIYRDKENTEYAVVAGAGSSVTRLKLTATVTAKVNSVSTTYPIRKIGASAFSGNTKIVEINLSEVSGLVEIGENAFKDSTIRYVEIGGNGTDVTIKKGAFQNTRKLDYVYAYSGIKFLMVEKNAFNRSSISDFSCYAKSLSVKSESFAGAGYSDNGCNLRFYIYSNTDSATIHDKAFMGAGIIGLYTYCRSITINKNAFIDPNEPRAYAALSNVYFGKSTSVISLKARSFSGLANLKSVTFDNPNATLTMGKETFSYSYLETIKFPDTLKTIPEGCFSGCAYLKCNPITKYITTIKSKAFTDAKLPQTVDISKNTTTIADDAFTFLKGVKEFKVDANNKQFKSVDGVLLSKNGMKLLCYPQLKNSTSYTTTASTIPNGAFNYNTYLKSLSIAKLSRADGDKKVDFHGLTSLTSLTIPATDYNQDASVIFDRYDSLFYARNLTKLNGVSFLRTLDSGEPKIIDKFLTEMEEHCGDYRYQQYGFMLDYIDKMATWVVKKYAPSSMSDVQKAVRLQKWIIDRVEYDPREAEYCAQEDAGLTPDPALQSKNNHCDASVFLHKREGKRYTVCDGYARCYKILMEKAGIETYYVHGEDPVDFFKSGHAWNLVKIGGKYYHVDVCWDDNTDKTARYKHFMCTDEEFASTHNYKWYAKDDSTGKLRKGNNVAVTDISKLGDLNNDWAYNSKDQNLFDKIANGTTPNATQKIRGDMNFDGKVNGTDRDIFNDYINNGKKNYSTPRLWRFVKMESSSAV